MFLARKIARAKWGAYEDLEPGELSADALGDLRTAKHTLSFWRCVAPENASDIDEVVLALSSTSERVDSCDVTWLAERDLVDAGLAIVESPGNTPVEHLVSTHVDVARLDQARHAIVVSLVRQALDAQRFLRRTKNEVRKILQGAIDRGVVRLDQLNPKLRADLG